MMQLDAASLLTDCAGQSMSDRGGCTMCADHAFQYVMQQHLLYKLLSMSYCSALVSMCRHQDINGTLQAESIVPAAGCVVSALTEQLGLSVSLIAIPSAVVAITKPFRPLLNRTLVTGS